MSGVWRPDVDEDARPAAAEVDDDAVLKRCLGRRREGRPAAEQQDEDDERDDDREDEDDADDDRGAMKMAARHGQQAAVPRAGT